MEPPSEAACALERGRTLLRMVNDRIRTLAAAQNASEQRTFICECGDRSCIDAIELTVADYDAVRANADYFLVAPERATGAAGQLVASNRGFIVMAPAGQNAS